MRAILVIPLVVLRVLFLSASRLGVESSVGYSDSRPRCSGHALIGMMVFVVLAMLLWAAVYSQMASSLRVEKACQLRLDQARGPIRAMAWGLSLLETGKPPWNPYSCKVNVDEQSELQYVITFTKIEENKYKIEVRPATESDSLLPPPPSNFNPSSPPMPPPSPF